MSHSSTPSLEPVLPRNDCDEDRDGERLSGTSGDTLCDVARSRFLTGISDCDSRTAREELKRLLFDAMNTVHQPLEATLIRLYEEVAESTDAGRRLRCIG